MSQFIVYRHSSGEVSFIKRSEVSSFRPVFINKYQYRIFVTVGSKELPVAEVESLEEAEKWILDQLQLIEGRSVLEGSAPGIKTPKTLDAMGIK